MSRFACVLASGSLALYGASCFVVPSAPRGVPESSSPATAAQAWSSAESAPAEGSSAFNPLAFGAALGLLAAVVAGRPALAADLENGENVFSANCAACHSGGNNSVVAEKKLKKEALVTYGKYDVNAIIKQVTYGNGQMPAFGERLSSEDIEDAANWVYDHAAKW